MIIENPFKDVIKFDRTIFQQTVYSYHKIVDVETAKDAIYLERAARWSMGGHSVDEKWFHSDEKSKMDQMGLLLFGTNMSSGIRWKTMSGDFVNMTPMLAQQIFTAAAFQNIATFEAGENLIKMVSDPNFNFETFDHTKGWPICFFDL